MGIALFLVGYLLTNLLTQAQTDNSYFLMRPGNEIEMTIYGKKGEVSRRSVSNVNSGQPNGETLEPYFGTRVDSGKGNEQFSNADVTVTCSKRLYSMDLRNLVPAVSMGAVRGMEVRVSGTLAGYPARMEPGRSLNEADLPAEPSGGVALLKNYPRLVSGNRLPISPTRTYLA